MSKTDLKRGLSTLSPQAHKALAALKRYEQLILTSVGLPVWLPAKKSTITQSWTALKGAPALMPSTISELSNAGLIVWEAENRIRLARDGE